MKWWMYLFLSSVAVAQQPAPEGTVSAALEGHVIHGVTKEPLRKARVILEPSAVEHNSALVAITDEAGHFRFADVNPGTYRLTAEKTGFLAGEYGKDKSEGQGSRLTVGSGDKIQNLTLYLFPGGGISGHVLDTDGDPVPDKNVFLWQQHSRRGKTTNSQTDQTTTNSTGEYYFNNLVSGAYYVSVAVSNGGYAVRQILVDEQGKKTKVHDLTTFYPSALSLAEAQAIQLESGQEQAGIDIHIQRGPTFTVKGRIVGVSGPVSGYTLSAMLSEGLGWMPGSSKVLPTGEFVFEELPPGKYQLHLFQQGGNSVYSAYKVGRAEVNVAEQDVTGVVITPFKSAQVRVRVVQEGKEDQLLTVGPVFLYTADGTGDQNSPTPQFESHNGVYLFPSVAPGSYQIWFNSSSNGYLKSIQAGGRKLDANRVEIAENSNLDLLLTLSKNTATISGEVEASPDQSKASVNVLLILEEPSFQLNNNFPVSLDQFLHFTKERMPPGKYLAFAVEDDSDLWNNPEFVKLLQSKGKEVKLGENETVNLHLKLIPKEETDRVRRQLGI